MIPLWILKDTKAQSHLHSQSQVLTRQAESSMEYTRGSSFRQALCCSSSTCRRSEILASSFFIAAASATTTSSGAAPTSWELREENRDAQCSGAAIPLPHTWHCCGEPSHAALCTPRLCYQHAALGERKQHPTQHLPTSYPHHAYTSTMQPAVITAKHSTHAYNRQQENHVLMFL